MGRSLSFVENPAIGPRPPNHMQIQSPLIAEDWRLDTLVPASICFNTLLVNSKKADEEVLRFYNLV